jgi:hypothetical protein
LNTVRNRLVAARLGASPGPAGPGADDCERRHRPIRSLAWQLFAGFVVVVVTLALAGAAHMTQKADADDLRRVEARAHEMEQGLAAIRSDLAELRAGQQHIQEDVRHVRNLLDEERRR